MKRLLAIAVFLVFTLCSTTSAIDLGWLFLEFDFRQPKTKTGQLLTEEQIEIEVQIWQYGHDWQWPGWHSYVWTNPDATPHADPSKKYREPYNVDIGPVFTTNNDKAYYLIDVDWDLDTYIYLRVKKHDAGLWPPDKWGKSVDFFRVGLGPKPDAEGWVFCGLLKATNYGSFNSWLEHVKVIIDHNDQWPVHDPHWIAIEYKGT